MFHLDPATMVSKLRRDVDEVYRDKHSRRERRDLVDAFSQMANTALEREARWSAVNRVQDGEIVYLATLNVYVAYRECPDSVDEELPRLQREMSGRLEGDLEDPQLAVVPLQAGPALRRRVLHEAEADPGTRPMVVDTVGYWLPIPDDEDLLYLIFGTPTLAHGDQYAAIFDDIAQAMEVTW